MAVWFAVIGACGIRGIVSNPAILKALSPTYALAFLFGHFGTSFFSLAAVVLAVTGAEALYADMGHFGRGPITRAWLFLVFPACILNYLGQGALVLPTRSAIGNPFFLLVPGWARIPMVILAAAATVIASQAVISGAFSLTQQAAQLGYLPRLRIDHTSEEQVGQIYVPWINWALLVAVLALVFTFRTSTALAYAYGMAVTGTITITTLLFFYIARQPVEEAAVAGRAGRRRAAPVDLLFFAANLTKLPHGAWLPLAHRPPRCSPSSPPGRRAGSWSPASAQHDEGSLREFIDELHVQEAAAAPGPGDRDLPQPGQGHRAAGPAGQRRAQPRAARARHHPGHRDAPGPARPRRRPARDRRPRLQGRPDLPCHRQLRLHGHARRPRAAAADPRRPENKAPLDGGEISYFLSTIEVRRGNTPGMSRVAQAPVPRHRPADGRRRRVLPAPPRPHRHHGLPHRTLIGRGGRHEPGLSRERLCLWPHGTHGSLTSTTRAGARGIHWNRILCCRRFLRL